ncbi:hypothetical protein [Glaciihabitans sp. dw_435]|uniref:hypothetical protein n=1 Tax=Glaciihabitans sp. dw_435 TaxID=2720081 RepID=UPI001BD4AFED|nr:hypothetical protein [Glaciihabitans sp. dw_435]
MSNTEEQNENVRIRRAPKIPVFIIMGGGIGAIVAFILTASQPIDPEIGFGPLFGYFALYGITGGVLLGAVVALLLDWASSRRARTVSATVVTTPAVELPDDPAASYTEPEAYTAPEASAPDPDGTAGETRPGD